MIVLNVNVDLVDQKRFFKGKRGRYLDLVMIETPDSKIGDFLVRQRGERDEKMPILGNGKIIKKKEKQQDNGPKQETGSAGGNVW